MRFPAAATACSCLGEGSWGRNMEGCCSVASHAVDLVRVSKLVKTATYEKRLHGILSLSSDGGVRLLMRNVARKPTLNDSVANYVRCSYTQSANPLVSFGLVFLGFLGSVKQLI